MDAEELHKQNVLDLINCVTILIDILSTKFVTQEEYNRVLYIEKVMKDCTARQSKIESLRKD